MGHVRVGTLPKTRRWREVVDLLDDSPQLTGALAAAITDAADYRLQRLKSDASFDYAFWLLTRIASSASGGDFIDELGKLGLRASADTSIVAFISGLAGKVRQRTSAEIRSADFAEIASNAMRSALMETIALQAKSLFGSTVSDLQAALRSYSTPARFAVLAERFFGSFLDRTLGSALDRQVANHIGPHSSIGSIAESTEFSEALSLYSKQSSKILQQFASDWYSLHNWRSDHRISLDEAQGFVARALDKLRDELKEGKSG